MSAEWLSVGLSHSFEGYRAWWWAFVDNLIQNHLGDMPQDMSVGNYLDNINWCPRLISWEGLFPCQGRVDYVKWRQQDERRYSPVSSDFSCPGPYRDGLYLQLWGRKTPAFLEAFFLRYFIRATGRETKTQSLPAMPMLQFLTNGLKTITVTIIRVWIWRIPYRPVYWMFGPQMMVLFGGGSGDSGGKA